MVRPGSTDDRGPDRRRDLRALQAIGDRYEQNATPSDADASLGRLHARAADKPGSRPGYEYCIACNADALQRVLAGSCPNLGCYAIDTPQSGKIREHFHCHACGQCSERRVFLDPLMTWWTEPDGRLWHESCGIFVRNPDDTFLFYRRTIYPADTMTVPSGHIDAGEQPEAAAARELDEEITIKGVHITVGQLVPVAIDDIVGDSCRRGSDAHRWHSFLVSLTSPIKPEDVTVNEEGTEPILLTLEQAKLAELTFPVRYVIEKHAAGLNG
jgi:8-oxo-dGTP pyrophosphatase MutT (NUDIX family)